MYEEDTRGQICAELNHTVEIKAWIFAENSKTAVQKQFRCEILDRAVEVAEDQ